MRTRVQSVGRLAFISCHCHHGFFKHIKNSCSMGSPEGEKQLLSASAKFRISVKAPNNTLPSQTFENAQMGRDTAAQTSLLPIISTRLRTGGPYSSIPQQGCLQNNHRGQKILHVLASMLKDSNPCSAAQASHVLHCTASSQQPTQTNQRQMSFHCHRTWNCQNCSH